jgi:predicted nucleotidyltransferase
MHASIAAKTSQVADLCRRYDVMRLELFGSAARGADFREGQSDLDFLVEFAPSSRMAPLQQFFGLSSELEALLGRPVDLVERGAIENPYILADIDRSREVVFAA